MLRIAIGSDHGGVDQKDEVVKYLESKGFEVKDVGTNSHESCHYPLYGAEVGRLVASKRCDFGIVICTSGEGIAIAANKIKGVRCGIAYNDDVARLMRQHNDANVIAFGAKLMETQDVIRRINIFLNTEFEGGRHQIRVDMIKDLEK